MYLKAAQIRWANLAEMYFSYRNPIKNGVMDRGKVCIDQDCATVTVTLGRWRAMTWGDCRAVKQRAD